MRLVSSRCGSHCACSSSTPSPSPPVLPPRPGLRFLRRPRGQRRVHAREFLRHLAHCSSVSFTKGLLDSSLFTTKLHLNLKRGRSTRNADTQAGLSVRRYARSAERGLCARAHAGLQTSNGQSCSYAVLFRRKKNKYMNAQTRKCVK